MILVDQNIKEGSLVEPFNEDQLNSQSYNVTLAGKFGYVRPSGTLTDPEGNFAIDPTDPDTFITYWETRGIHWLKPGEFILTGTREKVKFPPNVTGMVLGRSSIGRLGIASTALFAGFIDGGFEADTVVLEIVNLNNFTVLLKEGMEINQIVFNQTETPYRSYEDRGRYQAQGFSGSKGI